MVVFSIFELHFRIKIFNMSDNTGEEIYGGNHEKISAVTQYLSSVQIPFSIFRHPPLPTIEIAREYWKDVPGTHCKNLFFRNHKGDRHYLVIVESNSTLDIHDLEKSLRQGKLSFASPQRMERWLGVQPGSVSPFGLLNDPGHHVKLFIDKQLLGAESLAFHPNDNTATVVISKDDFFRFLDNMKNEYEFI